MTRQELIKKLENVTIPLAHQMIGSTQNELLKWEAKLEEAQETLRHLKDEPTNMSVDLPLIPVSFEAGRRTEPEKKS